MRGSKNLNIIQNWLKNHKNSNKIYKAGKYKPHLIKKLEKLMSQNIYSSLIEGKKLILAKMATHQNSPNNREFQ